MLERSHTSSPISPASIRRCNHAGFAAWPTARKRRKRSGKSLQRTAKNSRTKARSYWPSELELRIEELAGIDESELPAEGIDRDRLVKTRVNQQFFRATVLAAYNFRCCVSGLTVRPLLVASHIVPWSIDRKNRMNPRNGLCLNALHDRAFDRGLMTVTADFKVQMSDALKPTNKADEEPFSWLWRFDGKALALPKKFTPDAKFLASHRERWSG